MRVSIVQLRRFNNEQVSFRPVDPQRRWSDTTLPLRRWKVFPWAGSVDHLHQRDTERE